MTALYADSAQCMKGNKTAHSQHMYVRVACTSSCAMKDALPRADAVYVLKSCLHSMHLHTSMTTLSGMQCLA